MSLGLLPSEQRRCRAWPAGLCSRAAPLSERLGAEFCRPRTAAKRSGTPLGPNVCKWMPADFSACLVYLPRFSLEWRFAWKPGSTSSPAGTYRGSRGGGAWPARDPASRRSSPRGHPACFVHVTAHVLNRSGRGLPSCEGGDASRKATGAERWG